MTAPPSLESSPNTRTLCESGSTHEIGVLLSTIALSPTTSPPVFPRIPKTTAGDDNDVPLYVRTHHIHDLVLHTTQHRRPDTYRRQQSGAHPMAALLAALSTNSLLKEHNRKPRSALHTDRIRPFQTAQPSPLSDCSLVKGDVLRGFQFRSWHNNYETLTNDELCLSKAEAACFGLAQEATRMWNLRNIPQANFFRMYVTPQVQNRQISDRRRHTYWHTTLCLVAGFIYGGLHLLACNNEFKIGFMRWAWRFSSLFIAAASLLFPLLKLGQRLHSLTIFVAASIMVHVYIGARGFLVYAAVSQLWDLPTSAYKKVDAMAFIPHIG